MSWVISRKETGEVIGEFFDHRTVERFNPKTCLIETAGQYLCRLNADIMREDNWRSVVEPHGWRKSEASGDYLVFTKAGESIHICPTEIWSRHAGPNGYHSPTVAHGAGAASLKKYLAETGLPLYMLPFQG